jgi:hypothetical protein
MTTFQNPGSGGSGGDEPGRPPEDRKDAKDTEAVKEQVIAASAEIVKEKVDVQAGRGRGAVRVRRGGLAGALLARSGVTPKKVTEESKQERAEEAQKVEGARQAVQRDIAEEFWRAVEELGTFEYSPVSSHRHLTGGEDPDPVTIAFFADTTPGDWLLTQPRSEFTLLRTKSAQYGDGIQFTIHFRQDRRDKRRSVTGYYQQGKLTIIHVGPIT